MQAGRGSGKTGLAQMIVETRVAEYLQKGGHYTIWWITPSKSGTGRRPWEHFKRVLGPKGPFSEYLAHIDNQMMTIDIGGVHFAIKPAKSQDSSALEGDALNLVIYEEMGNKYQLEDKGRALYDSIYPAVSRVNGTQVILGTPPRDWLECQKGIFRELWDEAHEREGWAAVQWRTLDSPVYGGVVLPYCKNVAEMSKMTELEVKEYIKTWTDMRGRDRLEQLYHSCVGHREKEKVLKILSKGKVGKEEWIEQIDQMLGKRIDTLRKISGSLRVGQPEEAARQYDGEWLPRPQSIGEDILDWVKSCCYPGHRYTITSDGEMLDGNGSLEVWEGAQSDADYVIGVDPAGGGGGDYLVALVLKRQQLKYNEEGKIGGTAPAKVVAMFRSNKTAPDVLGNRVYYLAQEYNNALIAIERTGAWGVTTIVSVLGLAETNDSAWLYSDTSREAQLSGTFDDPTEYGWNTSPQSKGMALSTLRAHLQTREIIIPSNIIYEELCGFNWDKREGAENDDTVDALSIAIQVNEWVKPEQMEKQSFEDWYEEQYIALAGNSEDNYGEIDAGFISEDAFRSLAV